MKNSGKEEVTNSIVEANRKTQGMSTESIPISLTLKDNHTSIKESQLHKSSVANIRMYVTINQSQQPNCHKRTPELRQQDFFWMY